MPTLDPEVKAAFDVAYDNIYAFHIAQKETKPLEVETMPGVVCRRVARPVGTNSQTLNLKASYQHLTQPNPKRKLTATFSHTLCPLSGPLPRGDTKLANTAITYETDAKAILHPPSPSRLQSTGRLSSTGWNT
eukprot:8754239-Pyramimonas_sp.AAC.1